MPQPEPPRIVTPALLALLIGALVFIWLTGRGLPDPVASHFGAGGAANGWTPRGPYLAVMLLITTVVPLLLVVIPNIALSRRDARINLPNREYWLAPERRAETVAFLVRQTSTFAALIVIFLCYVQWLVARANALNPPALDSRAIVAGLAVFLACTAFWAVRLIRRFSRF